MKGLLPFLFAISLVACGWPTAGFAKADLQYTVRGTALSAIMPSLT